MNRIPATALIWAIALMLPFIYAAAAVAGLFQPVPYYWADPYSLLKFSGALFLALLAGAYYGFTAKRSASILDAAISVVPFFFALAAAHTVNPFLSYAVGIAAAIIIDAFYQMRGLAPKWWLPLRFFTSTVAIICLLIVHYA